LCPPTVFLPSDRARPSLQRSTADAQSTLRPPQSSDDHVPVYTRSARPNSLHQWPSIRSITPPMFMHQPTACTPPLRSPASGTGLVRFTPTRGWVRPRFGCAGHRWGHWANHRGKVSERIDNATCLAGGAADHRYTLLLDSNPLRTTQIGRNRKAWAVALNEGRGRTSR
jgi:hypothetical protein